MFTLPLQSAPSSIEIAMSLVSSLVSSGFTYFSAFKKGVPTCDQYALNTYLYTLSSILIFWLMCVLMTTSPKLFQTSLIIYSNFIFILLYLGCLFAILYGIRQVETKHMILKHFLLLVFITFFAFGNLLSYVLFKPFLLYGAIGATIFAVITYFIIKNNPNLITPKYRKYILYGLIALIIVNIVGLTFIEDEKTKIAFMIMISLASIMAMVMLLLIHHDDIRQNAEKCDNGEIQPDYVEESLNLFIVIVNLILDIARIFYLRKRK